MDLELLDVRVDEVDGPHGPKTRVSLACVSDDGAPVTVTVRDLRPYVLVAPETNRDTHIWKQALTSVVQDPEWSTEAKRLLPLCGYVPHPCTCLRVYGDTHGAARKAAYQVRKRIQEYACKAVIIDAYKMPQLFLLETGCRPQAWIRVPSVAPSIRDVQPLDRKDHAPMTRCVFDLECHSSTGGFPDAALLDDRIEIVGMVFEGAGTEKVCLVREDHVRPLEPPFHDTIVETFHGDEMAMLLAFRAHLVRRNTTVVIAHNGYGFDMPFLYTRLSTLVWHNQATAAQATTFKCLSCFRPTEPVDMVTRTMRHLQTEFAVGLLFPFGVAFIDSLTYFRKMFSLSSYGLNALGEHFLKEHKHDVSPGYMFKVFGHNPCVGDLTEALSRVVEYCMQDVVLTRRVCDHVQMLLGLLGLCQVTLTPLSEYMTSGQQVKAYHNICEYCYDGYYINKGDLPEPTGSYQGATVLDPSIGFHEQPVMCLDFASLYPTCIVAYNLCYSTIEWRGENPARDRSLGDEHRDEYTLAGKTVSFVKASVRKGVVPAVVEKLMAERKAIKRKMKQATGVEKNILDKLQWAVKITQNSIYGFMGVQGKRDNVTNEWIFKPMLANAYVAQAVTCNGRRLIDETCRLVKNRYDDAVIVYGDTDSAMVKLTTMPPTVAGLRQAFQVGPEIAAMVTAHFPDPILLEFENVYWPFVQKAKKRYATCAYEKADLSDGKRSAKGLEVKRRDNAEMLRDMYADVLQQLTPVYTELDGDGDDRGFDIQTITDKVRDVVTTHVERLVDGRTPLTKFVVTKQLQSEYSGWTFDRQVFEYKATVSKPAPLQGHVILANKINRRISEGRCSRDRPLPGDRLSYVIVMGKKNDKLGQRTEDPEWQREHGPPLDKHYYLDKAKDAITGICGNIVPLDDLFDWGLRRLPLYHDPGQHSLADMFTSKPQPRSPPRPRARKSAKRTRQTSLGDFLKATKGRVQGACDA